MSAVTTPSAAPATLIPFDLKRAKAGDPIIRRDGRSVRFVAHVADGADPHERVVIRDWDGDINLVSESGHFMRNGTESSMDIFMAQVREPDFQECRAFVMAALGDENDGLVATSHITLARFAIKHGASIATSSSEAA